MRNKYKSIISVSLITVTCLVTILGQNFNTSASDVEEVKDERTAIQIMHDEDFNKYCAIKYTPETNEYLNDKEGTISKPWLFEFNDDECIDKITSTVNILSPGEYDHNQIGMVGYTSTLELIDINDVVDVTVDGEVFHVDKDNPVVTAHLKFNSLVVVESTNENGVYYRLNDFIGYEYDANGTLIGGYGYSN